MKSIYLLPTATGSWVYANKQELDRAPSYHEKSLSIQKGPTGESSHWTAESYHDIGEVYQYKGDLEPALENLRISLEMRHKTLGETHYKVNVADTLHSIGLLDESEEKLGEALENFKKHATTPPGCWSSKDQRVDG